MANPQDVEIVKKGREAIIAWRKANPRGVLDLSGVNLSGAAPIHGAPEGPAPLIRLDWSERGRILIHFGPDPGNERINKLPAGMRGAKIWWHTGAGAAQDNWNWLADDSSSPYLHVPVGIALPDTLWYRVQYFHRRMNLGPFSDPATASVTA